MEVSRVSSFTESFSNVYIVQPSKPEMPFIQCGALNENVLHSIRCLAYFSTALWSSFGEYSHLQKSVT